MMDFKEFLRLYTGDPGTLHIAMELLLQNGRDRLIETAECEIVSSLKSVLSNLLTEEKLREVAETVKKLADLETSVLLVYLKRSALAAGDGERDGRRPEYVILTPEDADGRALGIDLDYAVLKFSAMVPAPDMPVEVSAELVFRNGERQDVMMVRPLEDHPGCEVMIWADPRDEYYTDSFQVKAKEEDLVS